MGNARTSVTQRGAGLTERTYRTSALPFRTANLEKLEIWQGQYAWVFFSVLRGYEELD